MPAIGDITLDRLSAEDLDLLYARLLTSGRKQEGGETGLRPKTVHIIHLMVSKALADALRKGAVVRNVATLADAPSLKASKTGDIKAWDADQLGTFLHAIRPHRHHPAFHLSSHAGMRRGEVAGIRWHDLDLDLDTGRLSVRQALVSAA